MLDGSLDPCTRTAVADGCPFQFEQVVLVRILLGNGDWSFCTGTVISPRHVLTAGHCASEEWDPTGLTNWGESGGIVGFEIGLPIMTGELQELSWDDPGTHGILLPVEDAAIKLSDMALLTLALPIPFVEWASLMPQVIPNTGDVVSSTIDGTLESLVAQGYLEDQAALVGFGTSRFGTNALCGGSKYDYLPHYAVSDMGLLSGGTFDTISADPPFGEFWLRTASLSDPSGGPGDSGGPVLVFAAQPLSPFLREGHALTLGTVAYVDGADTGFVSIADSFTHNWLRSRITSPFEALLYANSVEVGAGAWMTTGPLVAHEANLGAGSSLGEVVSPLIENDGTAELGPTYGSFHADHQTLPWWGVWWPEAPTDEACDSRAVSLDFSPESPLYGNVLPPQRVYGDLYLEPGAKVVLQPGTYYFDSFIVEAGATVEYDEESPTGGVFDSSILRILVAVDAENPSGRFRSAGSLARADQAERILIGVGHAEASEAEYSVTGDFNGTLVVAAGDVVVDSTTFQGAIWSSGEISVGEGASLVHAPFLRPDAVYDTLFCREPTSLDLDFRDFNVFVSGNVLRAPHTGGAIAAGKDVLLSSFQVNYEHVGPTALVIGGDAEFESGTIFGDLFIATEHLGMVQTTVFGAVHEGIEIRGFDREFEQLSLLSSHTGTVAEGGTVTRSNCTLVLSGSDPVRNVFGIDSPVAGNPCGIELDVPENSAVVVNVRGEAPVLSSFGLFLPEDEGGRRTTTARDILWNFPEAETVTISAVDLRGTVLAPFADVTFSNGELHGGVFAKSLSEPRDGGGELYSARFAHYRALCYYEEYCAETCSDGLQNQDETDVDCGGTQCGSCTSETCSDGLQNQDETGVDCGGATCPPCEAEPESPCTGLCSNPTVHSQLGYLSLGLTTAAECHEFQEVTMQGGNCGGIPSGRVVSMNEDDMPCNWANFTAIPQKRYGGYCVRLSAGSTVGWGALNTW